MKVLVCAGGTGGGIYPALTAVSELQALGVSREQILWVGACGEMEEKLVPRAGLTLKTIRGGAVVGVPLITRVKNVAKLTWSVGTAARLMRQFKPDVMLMTGGYMAAPVALAARLHGVPIVIFLPDVEPGSAIKTVMPLAHKVACTTHLSSEFVPAEKMVVTGYPLRPEIRAASHISQAEALAQFDLQPGRPTLFVFGGSRGSWNINQALMDALPDLLAYCQIIHVSGDLTWPQVEAYANTLPDALRPWYRPYPYLHEQMGAAFRAADLAVARAGASMLGESPAFGLPTILVPLAFAWRYQKVNADYLTERGAAVQLTDERLPEELSPLIASLFQNPARLAQMRAAARALAVPEAAARLAQVIYQTAVSEAKGATA
ncbi:MAG: UDP-N-acetylglucosamine--N-acetylmuramyl-(pentapeptide) pyrophosphoryl-undecaprenol N-acetylglucosamine transferase [Chloroflexi bacterium]|nr:UDP-N-acetylglucosamine--N-acetylmuramyl-(pentapeptide) pyrophosphoryl-undecaprenol N-acetylglucosamine transferase [Chloroflexota bacterium]